jgi:hypothetical protein
MEFRVHAGSRQMQDILVEIQICERMLLEQTGKNASTVTAIYSDSSALTISNNTREMANPE